MTQQFEDFCNEFEQVFQFDQDGDLILKRTEMTRFTNQTNRFYISLAGCAELYHEIVFSENESEARTQAMRLYGICYCAVVKIRKQLLEYKNI